MYSFAASAASSFARLARVGAVALAALLARADEGQWMPSQIAELDQARLRLEFQSLLEVSTIVEMDAKGRAVEAQIQKSALRFAEEMGHLVLFPLDDTLFQVLQPLSLFSV